VQNEFRKKKLKRKKKNHWTPETDKPEIRRRKKAIQGMNGPLHPVFRKGYVGRKINVCNARLKNRNPKMVELPLIPSGEKDTKSRRL